MHIRTVAAVTAISLGVAPAALAQSSEPGTLSVAGQGSVEVKPDVASLSLSVTRSAPTIAPALSAANRRVAAIVGAVRHAGVPRSGIRTDSVDTSCATIRVGPRGHKHAVRRCTASESLTIRSTAAIVGRVIDAATHAGASHIDGPNFSFADPSAGMVAAERAAIRDARRQADAAAAQLGDTVSGVRSIALNPGSGSAAPVHAAPRPPTIGASGGSSAPTTVHPAPQEVDATVAVVFTIAPRADVR